MSKVSDGPKGGVMATTAKKRQTIEQLMNSAFALTHKMHGLDKAKVGMPRGDQRRAEIDAEVDDLRDQRTMIVREVQRRAGEK